ncbi:uncharacterized protein LOC124118073 [Haliotis rufescens]|uniref:uncharacterized protein LOC124118073 n=1 Tax=Haliotis rufescens TaxID=6454 RepID=UPI001EAFD917|nr:uncharacterized protein LOC124118073 [Haliotis rufescens]
MATQNVFVLLYLCGIVGSWADPCLNPMEVPGLEKRDREYVLATGERALNDRLLTEGWYDAGGKVFLGSAPGFQHCGTRYPIWRKQKNGDNSLMCLQSHSDICISQMNIKTKMCGTKEIFNLKKTISSSAYCFGKPATPTAPTFPLKPTVTIQLHNYTNESKLEFRCEFSKHDDDVFYATNWVVNGELVLTEDAMTWDNGSVIDKHTLTEAKLSSVNIKQVGFELRCSVRASVREDTAASVPVLSDAKFIGIKISKKTLQLSEGEFADISLQLTAPFGCGNFDCELNIESVHLETTANCAGAKLASSSCGTVILASNWSKAATITVFGQVSQDTGSSSNTLKLKLATPDNSFDNKFWANYTIGVITVQLIKNTKPIENKWCSATNDPHMLTFDGRRYEHQYEGVFTMYNHTTFPIEVQIQTADCGWGTYNAWCNCGVAIRAGRTVFEFNRCAGQSSIWTIEYTLCEDSGDVLQVKKMDTSYEVYLPTGGRVTVNVYDIYLNVYIYPSIQDVNNTRGLCGTLSGNCSDDFFLRDGTYSTDVTATGDCETTYSVWQNLLTTFSNSWKVDNGSNLFDPDAHASLPAWPRTNFYCSCSPGPQPGTLTEAVNCTAAIHKVCDTLPGFKDVFPTSCTITERRRRRAAGVQSESPRRLRRQAVKVWSGGWTEVKARTFCENIFQESRSVQACKNVSGVGISGSIENCILDIQLTGTTDFFRFSIDAVRDKCLHEVLVDPELRVKNETRNMSVYDVVLAEACLNDCSGKGTCTNGDCVCQSNHGGSDCSVDLTAPPRLSEMETVDTCDMSREACDVVSVKGETFVDGVSTCLVEEIRVRKSEQENVVSKIYTATVVNIGHAQCKIETNDNTGSEDVEYVRAYRISIANSPGNYSDSVGLIVFNSTCIRVDGDRETKFKWTVKGPHCLDRGTCVPHGAKQSGNNCLMCDVSDNKGTWKTGTESRCKIETGQLLLISVAASAGAVVLFIIVVVASFCACKRSNRMGKKNNAMGKELGWPQHKAVLPAHYR